MSDTRKTKRDSSPNGLHLPGELVQILRQETLSLIDHALVKALDDRAVVFTTEIARRMAKSLGGRASSTTSASHAWSPVDSLSGLRALVGGRFANLKERWVEAGFPLRDQKEIEGTKGPVVNEKGWIELVNWMLKQGFEARKVDENPGVFFEIRKIS